MNNTYYYKALLNFPLFSSFTDDMLLTFLNEKNHMLSKLKKDEFLHSEGDLCETIDIVIEGNVISRRVSEDGNFFTVAEFTPGSVIGSGILFSDANFYPMNLVTKKDTVVIKISRELIIDLLQSDQVFLEAFLKSISNTTFKLTKKMKSVFNNSLRDMILNLINHQYKIQQSNVITLGVSKKDIAERFGVSRTSLSRELAKMREENLIDFDKDTITILNMKLINDN